MHRNGSDSSDGAHRRFLGVGRGLVAAMALGIGLSAAGCKDNKDDPDNLFVISVTPGDQQTNVLTGH